MERSGNPFDVEDPEARTRIELAYSQMLAEDLRPLVQPVVDYLKAQGHNATTFDSLPAVTLTLPKHVILNLNDRPNVGKVFLAEGQIQSMLSSAVPTNRVPAVWSRGFDGTGRSIAIIEPGDADLSSSSANCPANNCFRHPGYIRHGFGGLTDHATQVASAAASDHSTYKGVAPGVTIHRAGIPVDTWASFVETLEWALRAEGANADVVNSSAGVKTGQSMSFLDQAFDWLALSYRRTIIVAAGNQSTCDQSGGHIDLCSPAKAWNVLAVGAYDDKDNSNWSDDAMMDTSSYLNPSGDREKPEVVAPGVNIVSIGLNGNLITDLNLNGGTSFAAPQVAGLAVLLIQRNPSLRSVPEALRAIVMASAVHNIQGPSNIPAGQELRDGAGGIDAALADAVAGNGITNFDNVTPCNSPCWWALYISETNFPVNTYLNRYFRASRGEHIRVAISWWSNAYCSSTSSCVYDYLTTGLNLGVFAPDGSLVPGAWSASYDNNYELVEFIAPQTGQYRIGIQKYSSNPVECCNYLGIAWVKDATYLPDLRNNYNGDNRVAELYVRNEGAVTRDATFGPAPPVTVHYFDVNGNPTPKVSDTCSLLPNYWCWIPVNAYNRIPSNSTGSAIVGGGEDVAAIVTLQRSFPSWSSGAYAGFIQGSRTFYVPLVMHQLNTASGIGNSQIAIQNVGTSPGTVYVYLYGSPGLGNYVYPIPNIPVGATRYYDLYNLPSGWIGAARVLSLSSSGKLAVVAHLFTGPDGMQTFNALPAESLVLQRDFSLLRDFDWLSAVQNGSFGRCEVSE